MTDGLRRRQEVLGKWTVTDNKDANHGLGRIGWRKRTIAECSSFEEAIAAIKASEDEKYGPSAGSPDIRGDPHHQDDLRRLDKLAQGPKGHVEYKTSGSQAYMKEYPNHPGVFGLYEIHTPEETVEEWPKKKRWFW